MRPWIEYLITNATAGSDFIAWADEIDRELSTKLHEAVLSDELSAARSLAAEKQVYANIKKKVQTEMRERQSQLAYQQKQL